MLISPLNAHRNDQNPFKSQSATAFSQIDEMKKLKEALETRGFTFNTLWDKVDVDKKMKVSMLSLKTVMKEIF